MRHFSLRHLDGAAGLLALALLWSLAGAQDRPAPPSAAQSAPTAPAAAAETAEMVARLAASAREADPQTDLYLNEQRVALFRAHLPSSPSDPEWLRGRGLLARELLRAGRTQECLDLIDRILETSRLQQLSLGVEFFDYLQELQAVAWLRLGEQQNCIQGHTAASCIFPIEAAGVHRLQRGSKTAIEMFGKLLQRRPDDLGYRWLLNLAHMTLGNYPDSVPAQWLIPPETFRSDYPLPRFQDVAQQVGLADVSLAGGGMMDDLDGDGLLDVLVSSWGLNDQTHLFHNQGDGSFADRTAEAGLLGEVGGLNLVHADPDNDGDLDVLILRGAWLGPNGRIPNSLLRNDGRGHFVDATEAAGLLSFHPTQTGAWGDFDGDGWLDLFIGNESGLERHPCELYRNQGDGTFRDVAAEVGVDQVGFVKAAVWGDIDNDGDPDLFLSRFNQTNVLYRNDGPSADAGPHTGWRFTDISEPAGIAEPIKSFPAWFFDYDNDGFLDLMVASFRSFEGDSLAEVVAARLGMPSPAARCHLYRNRGDGTFQDVSRQTGFDLALLAMGANFGDLDNDGWLDAYFGTGEPNLGTLVPNVMLRNDAGKRFQDVTTAGGFGHLQKGHGIAFGDIDNDGDQDILAVMGGAFSGDVYANSLFENPGNQNHWVTLRLQGVRANRAGIGARVHLVAEMAGGTVQHFHHLVGTGGSFGSSSLQLEAGLGRAARLTRVEIRWPGSGTLDVHQDLPLDKVLLLREGEPTAQVVEPPRIVLAGSAAAPSQGRPPLPALPSPSLASLESAVRQQLLEARQSLEALSQKPQVDAQRLAEAYGELGKLYQAYGFFEAAAAGYHNAQTLAPQDYRWPYYLAHVQRALGDLEQAAAGFEQTLQLKPDHAPALLWLAQIELERRQVDRAKELLDRYKQVSPPSGLALFLLGQLAALRQDYTDAVRQYEAALVVDPQAGSVHYPLALAYQKLGNEESARRHLALRGSREPGVPDALLQELKGITTGARTHLLQGAQAMQAGDHEAAARQFRLAIEADPDDPTASLNLGAALLAGGKVEEGIRELERALQLALDPPNRSMVYFNLGVIAQARGRSAEAIEHFRQAVRWNPRNTQARQRLEALVGQTQSAPPL